ARRTFISLARQAARTPTPSKSKILCQSDWIVACSVDERDGVVVGLHLTPEPHSRLLSRALLSPISPPTRTNPGDQRKVPSKAMCIRTALTSSRINDWRASPRG